MHNSFLCDILKSSLVYYWKDAGQHGIYLLKKHVHIAIYNKALQKRVSWLAKTIDPFARGLHADASFYFSSRNERCLKV